MKKIHVIAKNWDNSYGGCGYLNSLAFYTKDNEKLEVTDVVSIGDSGAGGVTFKLNGINARIEWFNNYGSSYYPSNIFATGASYAYSILLYNMNSYGLEQQGFYIYFDKDISNIAYITLLTTYTPANNFVVSDLKEVLDSIKEATGIEISGILGTDFFSEQKCIIDFNEYTIY